MEVTLCYVVFSVNNSLGAELESAAWPSVVAAGNQSYRPGGLKALIAVAEQLAGQFRVVVYQD